MERTLVVHARGSAAQNQAPGVAAGDLTGRGGAGDQLAVDVELADPARDQLGVLGAEVEDQDGVGAGRQTQVRPGRIRGGDGSGGHPRLRAITSAGHPDLLGLLEELALSQDRRGDHQLGLLELLDGPSATDPHRRLDRSQEVLSAVIDPGRA